MRQMQLKFTLFWFFSIFAMFAVVFGYDFFHASNPSGGEGVGFLTWAAATLFLGFHLLKAYTDPLPTWYTYFSMPSPEMNAQQEKKAKRGVSIINAFLYLWSMTLLIGLLIGPRLGLSLERIALPLLFVFLVILVCLSLSHMAVAFLMFMKGRKTSNYADKT
jgi:hypothetical protein